MHGYELLPLRDALVVLLAGGSGLHSPTIGVVEQLFAGGAPVSAAGLVLKELKEHATPALADASRPLDWLRVALNRALGDLRDRYLDSAMPFARFAELSNSASEQQRRVRGATTAFIAQLQLLANAVQTCGIAAGGPSVEECIRMQDLATNVLRVQRALPGALALLAEPAAAPSVQKDDTGIRALRATLAATWPTVADAARGWERVQRDLAGLSLECLEYLQRLHGVSGLLSMLRHNANRLDMLLADVVRNSSGGDDTEAMQLRHLDTVRRFLVASLPALMTAGQARAATPHRPQPWATVASSIMIAAQRAAALAAAIDTVCNRARELTTTLTSSGSGLQRLRQKAPEYLRGYFAVRTGGPAHEAELVLRYGAADAEAPLMEDMEAARAVAEEDRGAGRPDSDACRLYAAYTVAQEFAVLAQEAHKAGHPAFAASFRRITSGAVNERELQHSKEELQRELAAWKEALATAVDGQRRLGLLRAPELHDLMRSLAILAGGDESFQPRVVAWLRYLYPDYVPAAGDEGPGSASVALQTITSAISACLPDIVAAAVASAASDDGDDATDASGGGAASAATARLRRLISRTSSTRDARGFTVGGGGGGGGGAAGAAAAAVHTIAGGDAGAGPDPMLTDFSLYHTRLRLSVQFLQKVAVWLAQDGNTAPAAWVRAATDAAPNKPSVVDGTAQATPAARQALLLRLFNGRYPLPSQRLQCTPATTSAEVERFVTAAAHLPHLTMVLDGVDALPPTSRDALLQRLASADAPIVMRHPGALLLLFHTPVHLDAFASFPTAAVPAAAALTTGAPGPFSGLPARPTVTLVAGEADGEPRVHALRCMEEEGEEGEEREEEEEGVVGEGEERKKGKEGDAGTRALVLAVHNASQRVRTRLDKHMRKATEEGDPTLRLVVSIEAIGEATPIAWSGAVTAPAAHELAQLNTCLATLWQHGVWVDEAGLATSLPCSDGMRCALAVVLPALPPIAAWPDPDAAAAADAAGTPDTPAAEGVVSSHPYVAHLPAVDVAPAVTTHHWVSVATRPLDTEHPDARLVAYYIAAASAVGRPLHHSNIAPWSGADFSFPSSSADAAGVGTEVALRQLWRAADAMHLPATRLARRYLLSTLGDYCRYLAAVAPSITRTTDEAELNDLWQGPESAAQKHGLLLRAYWHHLYKAALAIAAASHASEAEGGLGTSWAEAKLFIPLVPARLSPEGCVRMRFVYLSELERSGSEAEMLEVTHGLLNVFTGKDVEDAFSVLRYDGGGAGAAGEGATALRSAAGAVFDATGDELYSAAQSAEYAITSTTLMRLLVLRNLWRHHVNGIFRGETGTSKTESLKMAALLANRAPNLAVELRNALMPQVAGHAAALAPLLNEGHLLPPEALLPALLEQLRGAAAPVASALAEVVAPTLVRHLPPLITRSRGLLQKTARWTTAVQQLRPPPVHAGDDEPPSFVVAPAAVAEALTAMLELPMQLVHAVDVNDSLTPTAWRAHVARVREMAAAAAAGVAGGEAPAKVLVILEELNTSRLGGMLAEVLVHGTLDGERLPDNIVWCGAINPPHHGAGGDAGVALRIAEHTGQVDALDAQTYVVHELAPAVDTLVLDVGKFHKLQLQEFTRVCMSQALAQMGDNEATCERIAKAAAVLINVAHTYVADLGLHRVKPSIRDVVRCVTAFRVLSARRTAVVLGTTAAPRGGGAAAAVAERDMRLAQLWRALLLAILHAYYLRLDTAHTAAGGVVTNLRQELLGKLEAAVGHKDVHNELKRLKDRLSNCTFKDALSAACETFFRACEIPPGVAETHALKENMWALCVCIMGRFSIAMTGPAGCGKTLAMQIVCDNMVGSEPEREGGMHLLPAVRTFSFQCSRTSTAAQVEGVFAQAMEEQALWIKDGNDRERVRFVVGVDEASLASQGAAALMPLHRHMDAKALTAVLMTNRQLDAAKIGRTVQVLHRPATQEDLRLLAVAVLRDCLRPPQERRGAAVSEDLLKAVHSVAAGLCSAFVQLSDSHRTGTDTIPVPQLIRRYPLYSQRHFVFLLRTLAQDTRRAISDAGQPLSDATLAAGIRGIPLPLLVSALRRRFNGATAKDFKNVVQTFMTCLDIGIPAAFARADPSVLEREFYAPKSLQSLEACLREEVPDGMDLNLAPFRSIMIIDDSGGTLGRAEVQRLVTEATSEAPRDGKPAVGPLELCLSKFADDASDVSRAHVEAKLKTGLAEGRTMLLTNAATLAWTCGGGRRTVWSTRRRSTRPTLALVRTSAVWW